MIPLVSDPLLSQTVSLRSLRGELRDQAQELGRLLLDVVLPGREKAPFGQPVGSVELRDKHKPKSQRVQVDIKEDKGDSA